MSGQGQFILPVQAGPEPARIPTGDRAQTSRGGTLRGGGWRAVPRGSQKAWGSNVAPRQLCDAGRAMDPSASQLPR